MLRMTIFLIACALAITTLAPSVTAASRRHGESYIIWVETGGQPDKYTDGVPHYPGTGKTASGPYGLLASTRRWLKCSPTAGDRACALRYLQWCCKGSWAVAERKHKSQGYW